MARRDQRARKQARKARNRLRRELLLAGRSPRRRMPGSLFWAKERRGDAVEVCFRFSGVLVPFDDPADPSRGLRERTIAQIALAEHCGRTLH